MLRKTFQKKIALLKHYYDICTVATNIIVLKHFKLTVKSRYIRENFRSVCII